MFTQVNSLRDLVMVLVLTCSQLACAQEPPTMTAHFIDVGQADATLLEFPCGAVLIDAGSQEDEDEDAYTKGLLDYLKAFFQRRTDLNQTLAAVYVTHNHIDHTRALRKVVEGFTVKRYIDTGQNKGTGTGSPNWVRKNAASRQIAVREILNKDVVKDGNKNGLTDAEIDPLSCSTCDPKILILSGRQDKKPVEWNKGDFENKNNHSLVIRVDFGKASLLFTGDLEDPGIETLLEHYGDDPVLDVDVYHVGHHGSDNATTEELLAAMTPKLAVISCGRWDFGKEDDSLFSTWAYGHPRRLTLDLLEDHVEQGRTPSLKVKAATKSKKFSNFTVKKALYATAWDGTIQVKATLDEKFEVSTRN